MESHLSCQIQLCALLASKRRDFSSIQHEFFFLPSFLLSFVLLHLLIFFSPHTLSHPFPLVYPIHSSILLPYSCFLSLFLFPVGVVEGHSAHWLTFKEREKEQARLKKRTGQTVRMAEEGEGQSGGQAVRTTVQSSLFASAVIGGVLKGHVEFKRLTKNLKG